MDIEQAEAPQAAEEENENKPLPLVKWWTEVIEKARLHWDTTVFKYMREDMRFARGIQWSGQKSTRDEDRYVVNIVHRHLRQREAALYAKNPTAVAKRRNTLDFTIWGGDINEIMQAQQTLMQVQQAMQMAQQPGQDPMMVETMMAPLMQQAQQAQELLEDYQIGSAYRKQIDSIARTLEIVWEHQTGEQQPPFKSSMKHLVRRGLTTGVGYLKLGYHRFNQSRPEDVARVTDLTEQVSTLEAMMAQMKEDDSAYDETSKELAELQDLVQKVTGEQEAFMREGLDLDFPRSTSIIVDPSCYQLDGFLGARWIVQEFILTPDQIQQVYKKDVKQGFTAIDKDGKEIAREGGHLTDDDNIEVGYAMVWEVYDKRNAQTFTICRGHHEYLVEPKTPDVQLERFWPIFTLIFNGVEDEKNIYPPSDVELLTHMQRERNLMRQRVREHRDAARPGYVASKGKLDDTDKTALENREAHQVVELNSLSEQDDIRKILQAIPTNPIDPNQYETATIDDDVYKSVGTQEAVMGGSSGVSATESSIGESARLTAMGSAVDDLDDFLTEVTKAASHVLLNMMGSEKAIEIAGRGAIWPDLSGEEIAKDLWLEIRAGSSGRPNKAAEIQNVERIMPFLLQIPGIKPIKIAEMLIDRLDDRLQIEDLFDANLPSITAQNGMQQASTGDPATDPNQQGPQGQDKTSVEQGDSNLGPRPPEQPRVMDPNM